MKKLLTILLLLCISQVYAVTKIWVGTTTSYATGSNWSPSGVPGTNDDLVINTATAYPYVNSTRTAKSITFAQAGAHVVIKPGVNFTIKDKVENTSGSPDVIQPDGSSYGTLKISHVLSSTCDFIGDMNIPQLELSTSSGDIRLVNCDLQILEWLKVTSGTLDINNGSLTTIASSALTAYIHQDVGTTISGSVTIQQYVYANNGSTSTAIKTYHNMSSPCQSQTVGDIEDNASTSWLTITGNYYPYSGTIPDIQYYDETRTDVVGTDPWYGYRNHAVDDTGDPLTIGKGYFVRINPTNNIVDWEGAVNGPSDVLISSLTRTNNGEFYDGAHLIGNPYPEPIDWNLFSSYPADLSTYISIWKNDGTEYYGAYANYDVVTGTSVNGADEIAAGIVPIGQGFFIKVLSSASLPYSFYIEEGMRTGDNYAYFYKDKPVVTNKIGLTVKGNKTQDETVVLLLEDGSAAFDERLDFEKMLNPNTSLYTLKSGKGLAMNKLNYPEDAASIPLVLEVNETGSYTFELSQSAFTAQYLYYFQDKEANITLPILEGFAYSFDANENIMNDRFSLLVVNKNAGDVPMETTGSYCYWNAKTLNVQLLDKTIEQGQITVMDVSGKAVFNELLTLNNGNVAVDMANYALGMYLVHVKHATGTEVNKVILR